MSQAPGGSGPLSVAVKGHVIGHISCTNMQEELTVPRSLLHGHHVTIDMTSSDLTAWQVAFGTVG